MKTKTVSVGERVTLAGGRKIGTDESPGSTDLRGTKVQVVDEPAERVGSIDGVVRERVTVRPVMPSGKLGMPLDIPTAHIRGEDRAVNRFGGLGRAWDAVFGATGAKRLEREHKDRVERGVSKTTTYFKRDAAGKLRRVVEEHMSDGSVVTREE